MDLEVLSVDRDELGLVATAHWRARLGLRDRIAGAVDHRIGLGRLPAEAQHQIADRHHDRTELHRALGTQIAIRQPSTDQRGQIDEAEIAADDAARAVIRQEEVVGEVQDEQRAHPVEAEAFPRLDREESRKLTGMAKPCTAIAPADVRAWRLECGVGVR
jgi:hypothetical protein